MPKKARARLKRIPKKRRVDVRREEFDRMIDLLNARSETINELRHELDIQFTRTAQMQSELEEIQRTVQRLADSLKS